MPSTTPNYKNRLHDVASRMELAIETALTRIWPTESAQFMARMHQEAVSTSLIWPIKQR